MANKQQIVDLSKNLAKEWLGLRHDLSTRRWSEIDSNMIRDQLIIARNAIRAARVSLEKKDASTETDAGKA